MEHKDLLAKSMELLEEAMSAAFTRPERMNPEKIEQIDPCGRPINKIAEEMSDDEIDSVMNTAADNKFGKNSAQAKLHRQHGKPKPKLTPAQKAAEAKKKADAEAVAKADSESDSKV